MKKNYLLLCVLCFATTMLWAQDIINKVPAGASLIIKYSGSKLSQKVPPSKLNSYTYIKKKLQEQWNLSNNTKLEDLGLNLEQDSYQYYTTSDTTTTFVTLVNIKDLAKFEKFITTKIKSDSVVEPKKGFKFYASDENTFVGWDNKVATIVVSNYTKHDYYSMYDDYAMVDSAVVAVDSVAAIVDSVAAANSSEENAKTYPYADSSIVVEPVPAPKEERRYKEVPPPPPPPPPPATFDTTTIRFTPPVIASDSSIEASIGSSPIIDEEYKQPQEESEGEKRQREVRDSFYKAQAVKKLTVQKSVAEKTITDIYSGSVASIATKPEVIKFIDNKADITVLVDSLGNLFSHMPYSYRRFNYYNDMPGYVQAVNIYFETDKVRLEQQLYSGSDSTSKLFKSVFDSKQNPMYADYLRNSDIGYLSLSINTESMIHYYYEILKNTIRSWEYKEEEADYADAWMNIVEIMIDEKAIADVIPGNALFVLHGLKPKEVKYTTYEFDKNYEYKEIEKTKTEMAPDFSIFFETKNEAIFNKLAKLPLRSKKDTTDKDPTTYEKTGDYYTLTLSKKELLSKVYFMIKDGQCVITTSKASLSKPVPDNSFDAKLKQSVINNNYSGKFNMKSIIAALAADATDDENKKIAEYMKNNVGDLTFESGVSGDLIKSTTIFNIKGKHANSFEYFFNVIDNILKIKESSKK